MCRRQIRGRWTWTLEGRSGEGGGRADQMPRNVEMYAVKRANGAFFVFFFFGCTTHTTYRTHHIQTQRASQQPQNNPHKQEQNAP